MTNINNSNNLFSKEFWTVTSGDLKQKREKLASPVFKKNPNNVKKIVIDPSDKYQDWVGAGAALTDSTASLIWKQTSKQRSTLLHELFDPKQGGFSTVRVSIGACDFSSQGFYTYDDIPYGHHDVNLEKFSIGKGEPGAKDATKDLKYVVPVLQEILQINPAVKVIASPWSAPAWMKNTGHLLNGGHLRFDEYTGNGYDPMKDTFEGAYARYFVKFIESYLRYGIPIYALTIQNEPSNAPAWPAMLWTLKQQAEFGYKFLRPALNKAFPNTKLFINDDSFQALPNSITNDITYEEASAFDGLAVHTYQGPYQNLFNANRAFSNWGLAMTERRCMMQDSPKDASHIMFGIIGNWLIRNGLNMVTIWNLALDERGLPNSSVSTGRRGVVTIDHKTGKVKRSLEYYMLRNLGQDILPGSKVIGSTNYTSNGYSGSLGSTAFLAPNGDIAAQIYNPTGKSLQAAITINGQGDSWQVVSVPPWGTVTVHKSNYSINTSSPKDDEAFKLNPTPAEAAEDEAPGK